MALPQPYDPETPNSDEVVNQRVPIAQIVDHPRNYKSHPASQVVKLKASLIRFGQVRSAVVQATTSPTRFLMVAGHGIKIAAQELSFPLLKCDIIPAHWTDAQVEAYLVADNKLGEGGIQNDVLLAEILEEQRNLGFSLESMGSSSEELDTLLAGLANASLGDLFGDQEPDDGQDDGEGPYNGQGGGQGMGDYDEGDGPEGGLEAPETGEGERSDGSLLALVNVTIAEPRHQVALGQVWQVGPHKLVCLDVLTGWAGWVNYLTETEGEEIIFAPYAGPFVPLSLRAEGKKLLMVQPDKYIAGHVLDRFSEIHGEDSVKLVYSPGD